MRVHLEVEWLDGNKLDDETLFEMPDDDVVMDAAELGCLVFAHEDDPEDGASFTLINVAATRRIDVYPLKDPEPSDVRPVDHPV